MEKWERYGAELAKSPEAQELIRVGIWKSKGFDDILEEPAGYAALENIRQELKKKELEADERKPITALVQAGIKLTLAGEIRPMQKKKELFELIDIWDSADSSVDLVGILLGPPEGRLTETLRDLPPELGPPPAHLFARRSLTAQKSSTGKKILELAASLNSQPAAANPHVQKLLPVCWTTCSPLQDRPSLDP